MKRIARKNPTIAMFKRWLAKQPGNRKFDYMDNHHCLIASFMTETDRARRKWYCPGHNQATCGKVSRRVPLVISKTAVRLTTIFSVAQLRASLNEQGI